MLNLLKQHAVNYYSHILTEIELGIYTDYDILMETIYYINNNIYLDTKTDAFLNMLQTEQKIVFDRSIVPLGNEHIILI